MSPDACLESAQAYARLGFAVFPVKLDKTPLTAHGFKDASRDEATIRKWWEKHPGASVGIATGTAAGLVVLDVDPRHGGDVSLAELLAVRGPLPDGPVVRTGGGGRHYYFAHPGGEVPNTVGFRPGLDLRGDGGYVVAPPSLHASARMYSWERELGKVKLRLPPPWLLAELEARGSTPLRFSTSDGRVPKGQRHDWIVRTAAAMVSRFEDPDPAVILSALRGAAHQVMEVDGRTDDDIRSAVDSAIRKFARPRTSAPSAANSDASPVIVEVYDPERGELFSTIDKNGAPDIGIAISLPPDADGPGRIVATSLSEQHERIAKEWEAERKQNPDRARENAERKTKALQRSLPFARFKDALWVLPGDPTRESVEEWEARRGPLPAALERYFRERVRTADPDSYLVLADWALAATVRSETVDFAPRVLIEAPYGWGKSTAGEALVLVVPRSVSGAAMTPAAVHRIMNEWHPTLLVDESAVSDNPELLRVLRAGFKRGAKIIRAAQNADQGVVPIDPFGFVVLTTQVDTREDLISRCFQIGLLPGQPEKQVGPRDPESLELRTVLTRLRLEVLSGAAYPEFGEVAATAHARSGLEPRSRDKLLPLWPFAVKYGHQDRLVSAVARLESDPAEQLVSSDSGMVATAIAQLVERAGGLDSLKASDLELARIHELVERILIDQGEATMVAGEFRLDPKRYGPRDFTGKRVRELGFRVRTVMGRARLDLGYFRKVWPSVSRRYSGRSTLDEWTPTGPAENGGGYPSTPTTPLLSTVPSSEKGGSTTPTKTPTTPLLDPYCSRDGVGIKDPEPDPPSRAGAPARVQPVEEKSGEAV